MDAALIILKEVAAMEERLTALDNEITLVRSSLQDHKSVLEEGEELLRDLQAERTDLCSGIDGLRKDAKGLADG